MISFGETLRTAREAKGLTCSQVAAQTHMLVQIVEDMEREDFHRIAAPIYGRGFVRLFAECVGLDAVPLVREFMDIYEGRRAPVVRTREVPKTDPPPPPPIRSDPPPPPPSIFSITPASPMEPSTDEDQLSVGEPDPVSIPEPEENPFAFPPPESLTSEPAPAVSSVSAVPPVSAPPVEIPAPVITPIAEEPEENIPATGSVEEPPPSVRGLDLFDSSCRAAPVRPTVSEPSSAPASTPPLCDSPYLSSSAYDEGGPSAAARFRSGLSAVSQGVVSTVGRIPRRTWRIALLVFAVGTVLSLLVWGGVRLYQATAPEKAPGESTPSEQRSPTDAKKKTTAWPAPARSAAGETKASAAMGKGKTTPPPAQNAAGGAKSETRPARPGRLRSTGQRIPPLFAD